MTDWVTTEISTWPELRDCLEEYLKNTTAQWVFRGHHRKEWKLETVIERLRSRFGVDWSSLPEFERKLLREFRRRANIYHPSPPSEDDDLEWLALLRHHGGPTRLLDFTYSPFIAVYFAVEEADEDSAVWAVDRTWLNEEAEKVVSREISDGGRWINQFAASRDKCSFRKVFCETPRFHFVRGANPMRLNERLTLQQGALLCPGDITAPFEENLRAMTGWKKHVEKIIIPKKCRTDALSRLRKMNIDSTTLFPGLDGFARSLSARFLEIGELPVVEDGKSDGIWMRPELKL